MSQKQKKPQVLLLTATILLLVSSIRQRYRYWCFGSFLYRFLFGSVFSPANLPGKNRSKNILQFLHHLKFIDLLPCLYYRFLSISTRIWYCSRVILIEMANWMTAAPRRDAMTIRNAHSQLFTGLQSRICIALRHQSNLLDPRKWSR